VLAAGGFTIGGAVHLLGLRAYQPIVRPAILTAFLGYVMAIFGLLADLGKPWNMIMAIRYQGSRSALFEVAWCVMMYTTVLLLEFLLPAFEWLGWRRAHEALTKAMLGLTVLSVVFSTMHQSALGSLFLIAPAKLHPLWYSPYIFIFFFVSAVAAGISMVIVEGALSHRIFRHRITGAHVDMDELQIGLGKAGAIALFAYFFLKLQGVAEGEHWNLLPTRWGAWFLVEIVGFVLVPSLLFGYGARHRRVGFVRAGAVMAVLGIVLNRLNVSVIAYNWNSPDRYVPSWMEIVVSVTLVTIGVVAFRWIANRMPILSEDPRFAASHGEH
jgi:Ni/Fe-hydrogenase subunit HybB-like protein